jgi:ferredoxin
VSAGGAPRPAGVPRGGAAGPPVTARALAAPLAPLERLFDRVYGSRWNPLHQTGNLAILFFLVTLATGVVLFLFYRIADPHGSVARIQDSIFLGSWVRSLHRYSADLAMVAILLHGLRKAIQGQTWGPRALAWVSGVLLAGVVLVCGWTGLVLVWDVQGFQVAAQGARLFDLLPLFSEPMSRAFDGRAPLPSSFFFMNLFLHLAAPLGLAAGLWLHVSRLARPALLPPRRLRHTALAVLALFAALWPVALPAAADPLALPGRLPLDLFFAFWLPVAVRVPAPVHLALWVAAALALGLAPRFWRPRLPILPSRVDENSCTGCTTCYQDCPYEAITMVPRSYGTQTSARVARVEPARCVGCGICAGSCAPMGVGPPARTGREQLAEARAFLAAHPPTGREVVVIGCRNGPGTRPATLGVPEALLHRVACAGSIHTSVVETLLRGGVGGVFLLSCPPRDCRFREGPKWLEARVEHGREAELAERVDRRRLARAAFSIHESSATRAAIEAFANRIAGLEAGPAAGTEEPVSCAATAAVEEAVGA